MADFNKYSVIANCHIAQTRIIEIGTTKNIPEELKEICGEASIAIMKIYDFIYKGITEKEIKI